MIEKVDKVVLILHLVQDDFYLETDLEFFSVGSTQQLDLPWRNTLEPRDGLQSVSVPNVNKTRSEMV